MTIRTGPSRYASGPVLRIRLAIILSAVLIYFLSFFLIHDFFGDITLAIAVLPVGLAGWLFGVSGGVIIGLAFVPANLLLLSVNAHDWSHTQFGLGSFLVIGVGAGFGLVRDFGTKWKLELALREHSERELTRRTRELATISSIAQALGQSAKIDDVLKVSLDSALGVLDVTRGGIYIVTDDGKNLKLAVQTGLDEQTAEALRILPVGVGITGNVASSGTSRAVDNVVGESDGPFKALLESAGIRSAIFVPLKSKGRTVGVFTASSTTSRPFTQEEIALIETIGGQIGSAIESANLFEKMSQMSLTDELTGLCNRRRFNQVVEAEIMRSRRDGRPFSLVMIDLDSFKLHNDTYGHPGGDEVLRSFSSILRSAPRKTDTAFRLGGDEFSIVLPGAGAEVAWNVVNRVASAWAEAQLPGLPGPKIVNGVSVGVAEFPADGDTADRLISVADAELYRSKSAKKQSATVSVPETDRDMGWR